MKLEKFSATVGIREADALMPEQSSTSYIVAGFMLASGHPGLEIKIIYYCTLGFPGGSATKNPPAMLETQILSLGQVNPLEKEMATHFSILTWEIPWTEEFARLHSLGS